MMDYLLANEGTFDFTALANQVPVVVLALIVAWAAYKLWWVPGPIYKHEQARHDETIDENQRLRLVLEEKVLEALIRSNEIAEHATRVLETAVQALDRSSELLGRLDNRLDEIVSTNRRVTDALKEWE